MSTLFATGSSHGLTYIKETTAGVTPETPAMKVFRHTSCALVMTKESFQSAEIRKDAQIADLRHGNKQTGGNIGFELSFNDFEEFLAAAVRGAWVDNVDTGNKELKAGILRPSFTFEREFSDIGQYEVFTGCEISSMSLSIQTNAMVTGTLGIVGLGVSFASASLDPNPDASLGGSPLDGFSGALYEGGSEIAVVTGIELNIDNGMNPAFTLGSATAKTIIPGRINVTGTVSAYFDSMDLLKKFVDETESSLSITLGGGTAKSYIMTFPRIKYSGGDNPTEGEGAIMLSMPFQALYDDTDLTNIVIERIE